MISRKRVVWITKEEEMARSDELRARAQELGIPTTSGVYKPQTEAWVEIGEASESELHRRIKEEERHRREHDLWKIAVASLAFSAVAAIAAWVAVFVR